MCLLPAGKRSGLSHRLCPPGLPGRRSRAAQALVAPAGAKLPRTTIHRQGLCQNTSPAVIVVNLKNFAPAGATRACAALDLRPGSPGRHNLWDRLLRKPQSEQLFQPLQRVADIRSRQLRLNRRHQWL